MKKLLTILVVLMASVSLVSAVNISVRPQFGLGLASGSAYANNETTIDATGTKETYKNIYYSLGEGLKLGLDIDLEATENVMVGVGVGYSLGFEKEIGKVVNNYDDPWLSNDEETKTSSTKFKTSFIPLSLTLKVKKTIGSLTPYAGFGPTFAIGAKSIGKRDVETVDGTKYYTEWEVSYKLGIGFHGIIGVEYGLSDNLACFLQARVDQISLKLDKSKITKFTVNGQDKLNEAYPTTSDKETEYVDEYTYDSTVPPDPNSPIKQLTSTYPANSVTLALGIALKF